MNTVRKRKQPIIVIADSDEEERRLLRAILKMIGFQVIEAWDAQQVVKLTQQNSPDVLVVDLTIPRLGGADAVERIRKQSGLPNLPIVAVSMEKGINKPLGVGSSTVFLSKPIDYEQLYT